MLNIRRVLEIPAIFAAGVLLASAPTGHADSPGGLFMDFDEGGAAVVHPPTAENKARVTKPAQIPPADIVAAIKDGAVPANTSVIIVYQGKLYIVPDKLLEDSKGKRLASEAVMKPTVVR